MADELEYYQLKVKQPEEVKEEKKSEQDVTPETESKKEEEAKKDEEAKKEDSEDDGKVEKALFDPIVLSDISKESLTDATQINSAEF